MERKSAMKEEKKWMNRRQNGFTLVELIVVLVILSVVSAIAVPSVLGYIDDGRAKECESRLNALAADIATAKLSYEVDGEEGGDKFGQDKIQEYINNAGEDGKCPLGDTYVAVGDTQIKCPKEHAICNIDDAGSFSVAKLEVEENTEKRESPDSTATPPEEVTPKPDNTGEDTNPTPKPDNTEEDTDPTPTPTPEHTYRVEIIPDSLDMKTEETGNLQVKVYDENNNEVPADQIKGVTWSFPDNVDGTGDKLSASVKAQAAGTGEIQCTVTVEEESGATSTPTGTVSVTVTDPEPEPEPEHKYTAHIVPKGGDSLTDMEMGDNVELEVVVTDETTGEQVDPNSVTVEWFFPDNVEGTPNGTGTNASMKAKEPGTAGQIQCTVTVNDGSGEPKSAECEPANVTVSKDMTPASSTRPDGDDFFEINGRKFAAGSWEVFREDLAAWNNQYIVLDGETGFYALQIYSEVDPVTGEKKFYVLASTSMTTDLEGNESIAEYNAKNGTKLQEINFDNIFDYDQIESYTKDNPEGEGIKTWSRVPGGSIICYKGMYYIACPNGANINEAADAGEKGSSAWWPIRDYCEVPKTDVTVGTASYSSVEAETLKALGENEGRWFDTGNILKIGDKIYVSRRSNRITADMKLEDYIDNFVEVANRNDVKEYVDGDWDLLTSYATYGTVFRYQGRDYICVEEPVTYQNVEVDRDKWKLLR